MNSHAASAQRSVASMKLHGQISIAFAVLATFFTDLTAAQSRQLSSRDKARIIQAILRREDFADSETWRSELAENTVYLLEDNVSINQLPRIKAVKFILISQRQVDEMKKTGVEYYRFDEFKVRPSGVRVSFTREYLHQGKNSNGSTVIYTCRRTAKGWKLVPRLGPAWTAESP